MLLSVVHTRAQNLRSATAFLIPWDLFGLKSADLTSHFTPWMVALALVIAEAVLFVWLQRRQLQEIRTKTLAPRPAG